MAREGTQFLWPYDAEGDLSADQYKIVKKGTASTQVVPATLGTGSGVQVNAPTAGLPCDVVVLGITKVVAGAAIIAGAEFTSDANGLAIVPTALNQVVVGKTLTSAGAINELVTCVVGAGGFHGGAT